MRERRGMGEMERGKDRGEGGGSVKKMGKREANEE